MKLAYKNGITSVVLRVLLLDSASTTGAGLTGLVFGSSGLRISTIADNESAATAYTAGGSTIETIATLGTFAAPTAGKCRFKEVDATNHPGVYEVQIADARWAVSNARSVIVTVQCTGAVPAHGEVQLEPVPADATRWASQTIPTPAVTGVPKVDLMYILGTLLTETAGQIAAAFKKWFNVAAPTGTVNSLPDAVPGASSAAVATTDSIGSLLDNNDVFLVIDKLNGFTTGGIFGLNVAGEFENDHGLWPGEAEAVSAALAALDIQGVGFTPDADSLKAISDAMGGLSTLSDLLIAGRVQTRSPVLDNGRQLLLVRGNDYNVASGQPLEFTDAGGNWPDLTGAAVTLTLRLKDTTGAGTTVGLTKAGTVVTPTGSDKLVRFAPVRADTLGLSLGNRVYRFDIQAVLATGETVTLVLGDVTVLEEQTR